MNAKMQAHSWFVRRCFDLARLGTGKVSPNPAVGAVLVHAGRIIGEGYHVAFGQAHAEVMAIESVKADDRSLIPYSTLYVSLEPCCFFGKTPPCTNLIIDQHIPRVVISCLDNSPEVSGQGVAQLRAAGVEVLTGILEEEGRRLSLPRRIFVEEKRPYVILKFAKDTQGHFCRTDSQPAWISNPYSKRLVHKWRSEVDAIIVGTQTALIDDPELTTRRYFGKSPLRIVIDRFRRLPARLKVFDGKVPTLVITEAAPIIPGTNDSLEYLQLDFSRSILPSLLEILHNRKIGTLLVEGGVVLLQSFIDQGLWDEARVLVGSREIEAGRPAPVIPAPLWKREPLVDDELLLYYR